MKLKAVGRARRQARAVQETVFGIFAGEEQPT